MPTQLQLKTVKMVEIGPESAVPPCCGAVPHDVDAVRAEQQRSADAAVVLEMSADADALNSTPGSIEHPVATAASVSKAAFMPQLSQYIPSGLVL